MFPVGDVDRGDPIVNAGFIFLNTSIEKGQLVLQGIDERNAVATLFEFLDNKTRRLDLLANLTDAAVNHCHIQSH